MMLYKELLTELKKKVTEVYEIQNVTWYKKVTWEMMISYET